MPVAILQDPAEFLRLLTRHRVTVTFTPNFLLGLIIEAVDDGFVGDGVDLSKVRHIVSGGEAIVGATAASFLDLLEPYGLHRGALRPAFGMTESCGGCTYSVDFPLHDHGLAFANLGTAIDGLRIRIVDDGDLDVAPGQVGHVQLSGPMITPGYYRNPEATAAAFTADRWLRSGDEGKLNDGRLTLTGRSKGNIVFNGVGYSSRELETALSRLDGVRAGSVAAVSFRSDGVDTEQLAVLFATAIVLDDPAAMHRLIVTVRHSTVLHWGFRPALVLPVEEAELSRSSRGEIRHTQLRWRLESGEFDARRDAVGGLVDRQDGGFSELSGATEMVLAEIYAELFGLSSGEVGATAEFFEFGGTSLDLIRFKVALERKFGIPNMPAAWLLAEPSVRGLAKVIDAVIPAEQDGYDSSVTPRLTEDQIPLFCVHPGTGEVVLYVSLAQHFANERPFHALRARGFRLGRHSCATWDETIECYVGTIQAEQPHGPYALAGYSLGGSVIFEIVKRLKAKGEVVSFFGVVNQVPHIGALMRELTSRDKSPTLPSRVS